MPTVNLSFEFEGTGPKRVRTATVLIPFDWDTPENLGTLVLRPLRGLPGKPGGALDLPGPFPDLLELQSSVIGGHPMVVAMGGNVSQQFIKEFGLIPLAEERDGSLSRHTRWAQAIVIYPDPVTLDGDVPFVNPKGEVVDGGNYKFNGGNAGEGGWTEDVDDVGFVLELMHRVRVMLRDRLAPRIAAGVPGYTGLTRVVNPAEIYLVGYSAGAALCKRMAFEAPLVHPDDPNYEYRFAAMFLVDGSVGGYRHFREVGYQTLRVDFSPAVLGDEPATVTRSYPAAGSDTDPDIRIMHFQGAQDKAFPTQWGQLPKGQEPQFVAPDGTTNAFGVARGGAFVVVSMESLDNYVEYGLYSATLSLEFARADYTVEYGLDRWLRYKGLASLPATPVVGTSQGGAYPVVSGTLMEALPVTATWPLVTVDEAAYGLRGGRLLSVWQSPGGASEVVFLLLAELGHGWDETVDMKSLILDFFDGVYP